MKNTTITKLNNIAKTITTDMLHAKQLGAIGKTDDHSVDEFKNIKETIRHLAFHFAQLAQVKLTNIIKTTQQFNYLTNEVLHGPRVNKFFDNTVTAAPVQMTFNF